jgi:hypothetical protein
LPHRLRDRPCRGLRAWRAIAATEPIPASAFHRFGEGRLTAWEAEIAELVLKGNSSEAIGKKLGISLQGELFSRFVASISGNWARTTGTDSFPSLWTLSQRANGH